MNFRENIIQEAQEIEKRTLSLAEQHHRTALRWNRANFWQGTVVATATQILSIGTTSSVVVQYFTHNLLWSILTFSISFVVSILTSIVATHKPKITANQHKKAEADYFYLSKQARILSLSEIANKTDEKLIDQIKDLLKTEHDLNNIYVENSIPSWIDEEKSEHK